MGVETKEPMRTVGTFAESLPVGKVDAKTVDGGSNIGAGEGKTICLTGNGAVGVTNTSGAAGKLGTGLGAGNRAKATDNFGANTGKAKAFFVSSLGVRTDLDAGKYKFVAVYRDTRTSTRELKWKASSRMPALIATLPASELSRDRGADCIT
jgi:hypothetical protein